MDTLPQHERPRTETPAPRPRIDWRPGMIQVLDRRVDLRGVIATADYIDEAVRWNA